MKRAPVGWPCNQFGWVVKCEKCDKEAKFRRACHLRDDDDLPPYPLLDRLLRGLIDENASRSELIERGFDAQLVDDVLRRFYEAEFKRRQSPPGIAVTKQQLLRLH